MSTLRCAKHALLGCALCGADPTLQHTGSATPPRETPPRDVRKPRDYGIALIEQQFGRPLTPEERTTWFAHALTKHAGAAEYDTNDPLACIEYDKLSKSWRGRVYEVHADGTAKCPRCSSRVGVHDLLPCVAYDVRIPNFANCPQCGGEGRNEDGCEACDYKGWVISSWTQATAYLECAACVTREREPTRRGSASNFTTSSRAGEEYRKRAPVAGPLCQACQQKSAKHTSPDGTHECKSCRDSRLMREAKALSTQQGTLDATLEALRTELEALKEELRS